MSNEAFFFSDEPYSLAPRYFRLQPIGRGGDAESLSSYIKRLAYAHRLHPRSLVDDLVSSRDASEGSFGLTRDWLARNGQDFIGTSSLAQRMIGCLEVNTGVRDLRLCTILDLANLTCSQKLITRSSRVCFECLKEDRRSGLPMYERLLWRLEAVNACDIHGCALVEPICGQAASLRPAPNLPGICRHCGSIDLKCSLSCDDQPASEADIWVAQQCGRVLGAMPTLAQADPLKMKESLRTLWKPRGCMSAASAATGILQPALLQWLRTPNAKFSLFRIADIALTQRLDLVALLQGDIMPTAAPVENRSRWRKRVYKRVNHAEVEQGLMQALETGKSATQVAKELGVKLCSVAQNERLYRQVTESAKAKRHAADTQRRSEAVREAEEVIVRLMKKRQTPSLRNASAETGSKWSTSTLRGIALMNIRLRLGHSGVRPFQRASAFSAELQTMLQETAERIRLQFG